MAMHVSAKCAELVFWFALWAAVPATLLSPLAHWMLTHTQLLNSACERSLTLRYVVRIALLFPADRVPCGFSLPKIHFEAVRLERSQTKEKQRFTSDLCNCVSLVEKILI
jgi:hypothetical protein